MEYNNLEHNSRLIIKKLYKSFNGVPVLKNINLSVRSGEILALLGENGAGKSTISSIIAGIHQYDSGLMKWEGRDYKPESPKESLEFGIGVVHQELSLLPELSIYENIFVGRLHTKRGIIDRKEMKVLADQKLKKLGLDIPSEVRVSELQIASMQKVEIAKALALEPKLLILDEPTAALGEEETQLLFDSLHILRKEGYSFIYISHRLDEIPRIADRIVVIRDGEVVRTYDSADIATKDLIRDMVGRNLETIFPLRNKPTKDVILEVSNIKTPYYQFDNMKFTVNSGEILGVAGIVGAGRTELARCISGIDKITSGSIKINGHQVQLKTPKDAIKHGLVYISEDRKQQGLILDHKIASNILLGNYDRLARKGWCWSSKIENLGEKIIKKFHIKCRLNQLVSKLSGGNQQKVMIGKWISRNPKIIILDEPTRGIDVGAKHEIYNIIQALAQAGSAVIVISSELEEVMGLSHKILVLLRGSQRGILINDGQLDQEQVMALATTFEEIVIGGD